MEKYKVAVAADESCWSLLDAQKIINGNLAHVINIKLAKLGVLGALEIIDAAKKSQMLLSNIYEEGIELLSDFDES